MCKISSGKGAEARSAPPDAMLASRPFETIGIDVTGPHPKSANGFIYILTIVDHFSKFAFAYPMRNQEAQTVARLLLENVIGLVGVPDRILTDQGPNFESQLFHELRKALGVNKIRTSPYEALTNGITERFHLTLNAMLAKCVQENQRNWDHWLQTVMAAYRSSCHTSTSMTPNCDFRERESHTSRLGAVQCRDSSGVREQCERICLGATRQVSGRLPVGSRSLKGSRPEKESLLRCECQV